MNELSNYFVRFPLENPANYLGTDFDPAGAAAYRLRLRVWKERHGAGVPAAFASSRGRRHGPARTQPPSPHCWYSFSRL